MNRRTVALALAGVALTGAVATAAGWWVRAHPNAWRGHHPNVLVVLWDTTRADHLSLYGYRRPTTPNLEAFAKQAVVFDRASSPGIWTLPSHASLFTGLAPEAHGANEAWMWLDGRFLTMAEHFESHGYATFSMAANTLLCNETNLTQGFDIQLNTFFGKQAKQAKAATRRKEASLPGDASNELSPLWQPPPHGARDAQWARAVYKEGAPMITKTLLQWIDQRKTRDSQPFFAFINLMEAHTPRIPSMASRQRVMADDPDLIPLGLQTDAAQINLHFYNFDKYPYTDRQIEAINGVYDASLADLDQATGALFDGLAQRGLLDDTIVVFTSDHGENLGDHHLFNHRFSLWDSLVHVPLMIHAPGVPAARVDRAVDTIDLFATLSRLAGLPVPEGIANDDLLTGGKAPVVTFLAPPARREIQTVKNVYPDVEIEPWMKSGHAAVEDHHKLISMSNGVHDLYDLQADPGEQHPVDDPPVAAALDRDITDWVARWHPYDPAERGPEDDPKHVSEAQDELRKQMEALGYMTPDEDNP